MVWQSLRRWFVRGVALAGAGGTGYFAGRPDGRPENVAGQTVEVDLRYRDRFREIMKMGVPIDSDLLCYPSYVLKYSHERRTPIWVAEHLTKENLTPGESIKSSIPFHAEERVSRPKLFQVQPRDYLHSNWSRGHMAPAGDSCFSQAARNETYSMANIVPQDHENNSNYWSKLEVYCRDLTETYSDVYVTSGPLYQPRERTEPGGKRVVEYEVMGKSCNIAVPTHLFKVIVARNEGHDDAPVVGAFIIPNCPVESTDPLSKFNVPLESLEKQSGLVLFPELDRSNLKFLCKDVDCKLPKEIRDLARERKKKNKRPSG